MILKFDLFISLVASKFVFKNLLCGFIPGTLFLEFWKRRQATIQHKWDLTNFIHEEVLVVSAVNQIYQMNIFIAVF